MIKRDVNNYWEATQGGDGVITLIQTSLYSNREPENQNEFMLNIRSGFMEGDFRITQDELRKLRTFLNNNLK